MVLQGDEALPATSSGGLTLLDLDENSLNQIAESLGARSDLGNLRLVCRDLRDAVARSEITLHISKAAMDRLPALSARFPSATGLAFTEPLPAARLRALPGVFPRLRRLSMAGRLESVDAAEAAAEIHLFTGLERLVLTGWCGLRELPEGISALTGLRELIPKEGAGNYGWGPLLSALPSGISCLTALEVLRLVEQIALDALPECISCLQRLRDLDLTESRSIRVLPAGITALRALEVLRLAGPQISALPSEFGRLPVLNTLVVMRYLEEVPASFSMLSSLRNLSWTQCRYGSLLVGIGCCHRYSVSGAVM